jgi:CheY-like chemotaxis protein
MGEHSKADPSTSHDHLRSPGRGMNFGRASIARIASVLVPLLAEISRGETSLRAELIFDLEREDPEWARIMTALLMLHGDIDYRLKAAELAGAQRHNSARYVAVGLLLEAVLDQNFGWQGSSQGATARQGARSLKPELAALRSAIEAMPAGATAERARDAIRALEAGLETGDSLTWTAEHERREATFGITLAKLELTAAEAFAYLGREHGLEVPEVSAEAELQWTMVPAGTRLWWLRVIDICFGICAREKLGFTDVEWVPSNGSEEAPVSLRIAIDADAEGLQAVGQRLSQWVARLQPALSRSGGGHLWRVEREGGNFIVGMESTTVEHPAQAIEKVLQRKMRVVVVDDEPIIASVVHRVLSRRLSVPCEFQVFTSSEEALKSLTSGPETDLVISDVNMPSMSGQELYAQSVEANDALSQRFVFVSGMELPAQLLESYRLGMVEFVRKPFRPEELLDAVNRVMERIASSIAAQ